MRWAEGPVWFGDLRLAHLERHPNNRILRWGRGEAPLGLPQALELRQRPNARTAGAAGHCEHGGRRVTRTEPMAPSTCSRRAIAASGSIRQTTWWSSPTARCGHRSGIRLLGHYGAIPPRRSFRHVYRIDPARAKSWRSSKAWGTRTASPSPRRALLYVVECAKARAHPRLRPAGGGRRAGNGRVLIDAGAEPRMDSAATSRANSGGGWGMGSDELDGVRVFAPPATHRSHPPARALRQRVLRRGKAKPPLHGGGPGVYALYVKHAGRRLFLRRHDLDEHGLLRGGRGRRVSQSLCRM